MHRLSAQAGTEIPVERLVAIPIRANEFFNGSGPNSALHHSMVNHRRWQVYVFVNFDIIYQLWQVCTCAIAASFIDATVKDKECQDMCGTVGYIWAIVLAMRLGIGTYAHFAPVCSTWVWVSRGSTKRSGGS